jgi:hypothetical protein
MWDAAATPKTSVSSTSRGRHFRRGVYTAIDAEGCEDLGIRCHAHFENGGRKTVEGEGDVTAQIAVESSRNPPKAAAKNASASKERQAQKQKNVRHLVAQLPCAELAIGLHHAIFRLAKMIEAALHEEIQREWKPRDAVGQHAVSDVAATGEVAGQGCRTLPHFTATPGVLIVAI